MERPLGKFEFIIRVQYFENRGKTNVLYDVIKIS